MSAEPSQTRLRVLIVDQDAVVRDLLASELSAAGYEVDTLSSGTGFTEDMVWLIHPDLLLIDPFLQDVSFESVTAILIALHSKESFKLVLIDSTTDPAEFAKVAARVRAEGVISKRDLLRAPADAVAEQFLPEVEVMEPVDDEPQLPSAQSATAAASEIELSIDRPERRPPPGPNPTVARPAPRAAAPQPQLRPQPMSAPTPAAPPRHPSIAPPPPPAPPANVERHASRAPPPPPADSGAHPSRAPPPPSPAAQRAPSRAPPPAPADSGVHPSRAPPPPAGTVRPGSRAPPPPPADSGVPRPAASQRAVASKLMSMIEQEVGDVSKLPARAAKRFVVEVNLFSRNNFYVGPSGDLRTGGVFVATAVLPQVGDQVQVQIQLISMPPLDTEGVVEWVRQANKLGRVTPGAGVSLAHLPDQWRSTLEVFFGERAPLTHLPAGT